MTGQFHARAWVRPPLPPYRNAVPKCWSRTLATSGPGHPGGTLPPQATYRLHVAGNGPHTPLSSPSAGTELRLTPWRLFALAG